MIGEPKLPEPTPADEFMANTVQAESALEREISWVASDGGTDPGSSWS